MKNKNRNELYTLHVELDIVKVIKTGRLRWLGHHLECKNWILTESLLFLNQKALDV